jgi:hypothetical protein
MSNKIHEYFERKPTKWNIVDFLNECNEELFKSKIGLYISLSKTSVTPRKGKSVNEQRSCSIDIERQVFFHFVG